ncbi:MAG: hypothetical protein L0Y56_12985 [Nitrospira sp.]|nr:hypothetical protein [Nitrospira sp.]
MKVNGYAKIVVGACLTAILALAAWGGKTLISHSVAIATQDTKQDAMEKWLDRVEKKLDRALRHLRQEP